MELQLNIYENGKVLKTYTSNDFTLTTGICEDVLELVDIDSLMGKSKTQEELGLEILKVVIKLFPKFKPFLQEIFVGLTDDEFRKTAIKEVGTVIINIVRFTISELYSVKTGKN